MRINRTVFSFIGASALLAGLCTVASAQSTVTLPDSSSATTLTATVAEQCRIQVPTGVAFNVTNIGSSTVASAASVTIDQIVLATATKKLRVSIQANASAFTPSVAGATTWDAADISWNAATWTNGTGAAGTLSSSAYTEVSTADADVASTSTTGLVFTLAAKTTVKRAGDHTLNCTWKVESVD